MAALQATEQLGFIDFSTITSGITSLAKSAAPELIKASLQKKAAKKIAKNTAKTAKYQQQAVPAAAVVAAPAVAMAVPQPEQKPGYDLSGLVKPVAIGGGFLLGAVVLNKILNKKSD